MNQEFRFPTGTARATLLVELKAQGLVNFRFDPVIGGIFRFEEVVAHASIIDSVGGHIRVGLPSELHDLVIEPWDGWLVDDQDLILIGVVPNMPYGFEVRLPVTPEIVELFRGYPKPVHLGVVRHEEITTEYDIDVLASVPCKQEAL